MPPATRTERFSMWLVHRLPNTLVREPERVMLNVATGVVGILSLLVLAQPGTIATVLPVPLLIMWSITLIVGALMTVSGMFRSSRITERSGLMLTAIGCIIYAFSLFSVGNARGHIIGYLFLAIALTKVLRLLISTAGAAIAAGRKPHDPA